MIVTVLRTTYPEAKPPFINNYRVYKSFLEQTFKRELKEELDSIKKIDLENSSFQNCVEKVLDNLRKNNEIMLPRVRTTIYGSETIKKW